MRDATLMQHRQAAEHLAHDLFKLHFRQRSLFQQPGQRHAGGGLNHGKQAFLVLAHLKDAFQVRVPQIPQGLQQFALPGHFIRFRVIAP